MAIAQDLLQNFVGGQWVSASATDVVHVLNPATSELEGQFFGDLHAQGRDAIDFYTEKKVVVERWPTTWIRKF